MVNSVENERLSFEVWAKAEGLIQESHGIRYTNSMCDVALKAWKDGRTAIAAAPVQAQEPFAYMIVDESGEAYFGEFCVASGKTDLEAELEGLNYGQDGKPYKIVPVFRAPVQPVAVPDGWKLVPIDATRTMIDAASTVEENGYDAMHKAMLAAAPAAPAAQGDALNAKRYEYLRSDDEGIEFRDKATGQWRADCPSGELLDKIIDAAIAAKAVTP